MKSFVLIAALALACPAVAETYGKYETPQYSVLEQDGSFEIRQYEPALMAEVTVRSSQSGALRQGFQILAGYIFGGNTSAANVAMTSPVAQAPAENIAMTSPVTQTGGDGLWTVQFMMPSQYTMDTLPEPKNDAIRFVMSHPGRQVAVRFSGWAGSGRLVAKEAELRAYAAREGLNITGPAQYLIYDDPLTLPWQRRNEVALPIE
ncbi:SOUL heme-binding protein [Cognatiyoonia koreensis]|uniref:SOUL heme-binding protein n=1 Tax=Cognatiyoonia koreensis TaxID=364200 RepID=A0A1I0RYL0_9RHOB|nr:heme-binding protein [Cognatiyoonia koreensis]SEW45998.1 SOUL heme-binding protein [Cognatiyoonia koreensis]